MSKTIIVCPFSKAACRECAIYRGRHVELCAASRRPANGTNVERPRVKSSAVFTCWDFPDIGESPGRMVNIEDFIERRGI
ncbi:MAG: hypothetical protein ABSE25_01205 [Syntrophorhabdales bacterium]